MCLYILAILLLPYHSPSERRVRHLTLTLANQLTLPLYIVGRGQTKKSRG